MKLTRENRKVYKYLMSLYDKDKDRGQIKDLFEGLITLPPGYIDADMFLSILNEIRNKGYTENFIEITIKLAQGISYHNSILIEPRADFSYIQEGIYVDRKEILAICENAPNYRDKAVILGVFEGLMGKEMEELLEIRPQDMRPKSNKIYIRSREEEFEASDELIHFLKKAREQKEYVFLNKGAAPSLEMLEDNGTMLKKLNKGKAGETRLMFQCLIRLCTELGFKAPITFRHIRNCGKKYYLDQLSEYWIEDPKYAIRDSEQVRNAFFERFGLKTYISLNKMMEPINKLITTRPTT